MTFEDLIPVGMFGSYLGMIALDFVAPARRFPSMRWWRARGIAFFVMSVFLNVALPLIWGDWFARLAPLDLRGLGTIGGAALGFVVLTFVSYWLHRAQHRFGWMWRMGHQLHHSAERVDIWGAFYFHPIDVVMVTLLQAGLLGVLGLSPHAVALAGAFGFVVAAFQHANLRTPRWLGYLVPRPEAHAMHHERGVHGRNYGDLPLWDIVFGTFHGPEHWEGEAGFEPGASERVVAMLAFRDVSSSDIGARRSAASESEGAPVAVASS